MHNDKGEQSPFYFKKMEKKTWGGKREGSGRKQVVQDGAILYCRIEKRALDELKKRAKETNKAVGVYITEELNLL